MWAFSKKIYRPQGDQESRDENGGKLSGKCVLEEFCTLTKSTIEQKIGGKCDNGEGFFCRRKKDQKGRPEVRMKQAICEKVKKKSVDQVAAVSDTRTKS